MLSTLRTGLVACTLVAYAIVVGPPALLVAWLTGRARVLFGLGLPALRLGLWLGGIRYSVAGLERLDPEQNYLFMPNHGSNLDPPLLLLALGRDLRMMGKARLFRVPVLGQALQLAEFVPVVREDRDRAILAVEAAAERLRRGFDFVVFPEGTRNPDGQLLPLKKGPFFMALKSNVPVVPVILHGAARLLPKGSRLISPGEVRVEIMEPIPTVGLGLDQRDELRATVRHALLVGLGCAQGAPGATSSGAG